MTSQFTMLRRRTVGFLAIPALMLGLMVLPGVPAAMAEETHVTISAAAYGATRKFEVEINKTALVDLPAGAAEVIVSQPNVAAAIMRTRTRALIQGITGGDTNIFFLDDAGRTIAVLGNGVRGVYPPEHRELAARIAGQGAVLSDFHPDAPPDGPNFPARNRLISGLALGVIVVEAPMRSGALITVDFAADQGRDVFAVPGSVLSPASAGCNRILRDGARPVRSADDVLEDLRLGEAPQQIPLESPAALDEESRRILSTLTAEALHIDEISTVAGIPIASLSALLMTLELQGFVRNVGAQYYARAR